MSTLSFSSFSFSPSKQNIKNNLPSSSLLCALRALVAAPSNARSVGSPLSASPNAPKTGEAASESSLFTSRDAEMYLVWTRQYNSANGAMATTESGVTPTTMATANAVEAAQVSADCTTSPRAESRVSTSFEKRLVRRPCGCASKKAIGSLSTRRSMREWRVEAARREPRTVAAARAAWSAREDKPSAASAATAEAAAGGAPRAERSDHDASQRFCPTWSPRSRPARARTKSGREREREEQEEERGAGDSEARPVSPSPSPLSSPKLTVSPPPPNPVFPHRSRPAPKTLPQAARYVA